MTKSLLARVQIWTILIASAIGLVAWYAISLNFAAGLFLTALWAVVGLMALEGILRAAVVPQGTPRNEFALIIWVLIKIAVYGLAMGVIFPSVSSSQPRCGLHDIDGHTGECRRARAISGYSPIEPTG